MEAERANTPETLTHTREDIFKHRSAINELKQAFDVTAVGGGGSNSSMDTPMAETPLETPINTVVGPRAGGVRFAPVPEDTPAPPPRRTTQELAQDVLLFSNPILSGTVLLAGAALIAAVHFLIVASPLTFLSAVCYALLGTIAVNFVRSLISRRWQEQGFWRNSSAARSVADRLASAVDAASHAHDTFLSARDPMLTLRVAGGVWVLAVLGSYLSFWNVVTLAFVLAFTLPVGYQKYRPTITSTYRNASGIVKARWDALGLSRKQKAALLAVLLVALWVNSAWSTRLSALLVGALAVRCHLKPTEVDYIITHAEPYTQSVKKSARRLSIAATDFARRNLGGAKAHAR